MGNNVNYLSFSKKTVRKTHKTRSLLGSGTDMLFGYQIALWVSGECKIVGRFHGRDPWTNIALRSVPHASNRSPGRSVVFRCPMFLGNS